MLHRMNCFSGQPEYCKLDTLFWSANYCWIVNSEFPFWQFFFDQKFIKNLSFFFNAICFPDSAIVLKILNFTLFLLVGKIWWLPIAHPWGLAQTISTQLHTHRHSTLSINCFWRTWTSSLNYINARPNSLLKIFWCKYVWRDSDWYVISNLSCIVCSFVHQAMYKFYWWKYGLSNEPHQNFFIFMVLG